MENQIMGMSSEEYNRKASFHSRVNIFLWLIGGIIFSIFTGRLVSVPTLLLFLPGIFVISFASIPTFFVNVKKYQIVPRTNNIFILLFFTIWFLIDLAYPIFLSKIYILLIEFLFKLF